MKKCFGCGAELDPSAAFCGKCGRQVRGKGEGRAPGSGEARQQKERDAALRKRGAAELDALRIRIIQGAQESNRKTKPYALGLAIFAVVVYMVSGEFNFYSLIPFAIALGLWIAMARNDGYRWLGSSEYYSITGSTDPNGKHRCIFCSHKGIFKRGQYKGNSTFSYCSKCREPLFAE